MEITNFQRAEVITQALPYIQKYHNKIIVIKYGGNAMINQGLKEQVMEVYYLQQPKVQQILQTKIWFTMAWLVL